jgi:molybdopterin molybdotransferase
MRFAPMRHRKGKETMISYEAARTAILQQCSTVGAVREYLLNSLSHVAAEDVVAPRNLPAFDNSAMDGFAVRFSDDKTVPEFSVIGIIHAGGDAGTELQLGSAVRIMTGAPVPALCDAVIPFEDVDEAGDIIHIKPAVTLRSGQHIRHAAEDVRQGDTVIECGTLLGVAQICMLAALGMDSVLVYRKPRVAILATGDELVEPGQPLAPGKIYNSNSLALAAAVVEAGATPVLLGIARDDRERLKAKIIEGLDADLLLTAAGVSAGDRDLVRPILEELGMKLEFWKVEIKPGKVLAFGTREGKPVISLPGNPVSALVVFEEFVRPALLKMQGRRRVLKHPVTVVLQQELRKKPGRVFFSRLRLEHADGTLRAWSAGNQDTGALSTMLHTDALAILPEHRATFSAGDLVNVHLLNPQFEMQDAEDD